MPALGCLLDTVHLAGEHAVHLPEEGLAIGVGLEELQDRHLDGFVAAIEQLDDEFDELVDVLILGLLVFPVEPQSDAGSVEMVEMVLLCCLLLFRLVSNRHQRADATQHEDDSVSIGPLGLPVLDVLQQFDDNVVATDEHLSQPYIARAIKHIRNGHDHVGEGTPLLRYGGLQMR
jgi:hypothetical protein